MLIPDNITEFNSFGEQILYKRFQNDGSTNSMYILHSVFTNHHLKNISGEIDFLVLVPNEGFFCIEVKHGGISRKNGNWCFTNRYGVTECKKTGPFAQQSATMNSLRKYVLKKLQHKKEINSRFERFLWGTGVAFTSMAEFIDFGPEGHSWQILTKQGLNLPIGSYIKTLSKGSHKEHSKKYWYDIHKSRPTKKDCEIMVDLLRGDFEISYSEINKINDNEVKIEKYTHEQFNLLDFINYNPRCLIEGTAGTGKTLMALEITKRKCLEKKKVGLFCFNGQLGLKLKESVENISKGKEFIKYAGTLHSFMMQNSKSNSHYDPDKIQNYYFEDLPIDFLINNEELPEDDKLDILIIDESQDLLSPYYIEVFNLILKGGFKNGNWVLFGDFSNQAIYINDPEKIFELLTATTTFTRFPPLKINCRNTKRIASQNTLLTGINLPQFSTVNIDGSNVISKYPSKINQPKIILEILLEIESREIPLNRVSLLSPKKIEKSILAGYQPILDLMRKGLKSSTIQGYKGMENTIIILYDFDEVSSSQMQRLLYVGISRARQELYFVLDRDLKESISKLIELNYPKTKKDEH
ncbi:NERD domain-containing protein [Maribacter sp. Asnod2-G09]|uniref:nuclease-related domain-containing DEAD/DEAH box helicase n=1 Tax=Maribacter sp. Asnod2-G09 TaxID=3160577 RepID=UPI00386FF0A1